MTASPQKPKGSRQKNVALAITTIAALLLLVVGLQLYFLPPVNKSAEMGSNVAATTDWQGLGWGETRKLVVDSKGTIYLAYRAQDATGQGAKAFVDFSTDNGLTWGQLGGGPIRPGNQVQRVPAIALGSDDVLQVVWYEVPNDQSVGADRQIWYSRWLGDKWLTPKIIPYHVDGYEKATDPTHWQEHPDIIVDRFDSRRVYVVWEGTDLANLTPGNCGSSNCDTPMFTNSTDRGDTWSSYLKLSQPTRESQSRPTIVEDSNGILHVAWYSSDPGVEGNSRIRYETSPDYGKTWSPETTPIAETYGLDQRYPSLAADPKGRVHMVWKEKDQFSSRNQTLYSVLSAGTWSTPLVIHPDGQNQLHPMIQVDDHEDVYVGWHSGGPYSWDGDPPSQFDGSQIWLAKFNGTTWSARQLTSSTTNRFINFPADPMKSSNIQIAWVEGNSRPYSIKFATLTF